MGEVKEKRVLEEVRLYAWDKLVLALALAITTTVDIYRSARSGSTKTSQVQAQD